MKTKDPMKPVGAWEVRRTIKLPALSHENDTWAVERALGQLPGVRRVAADLVKRRIVVRYDATGSDYQSIVTTLEEVGFPPLDSWWSRFKGNLYQFLDTNAQNNSSARPSPCCNKPPK